MGTKAEAVWEETTGEIRLRIEDPSHFRAGTFRRKAVAGIEGVDIIIGKLLPEFVFEGKDAESMVALAYRFAKSVDWDMEKAQKWASDHDLVSKVASALEELASVEALPLESEASDEEETELHQTIGSYSGPELLESMAKPVDQDVTRVSAYIGNKYFILEHLWKHTPKEAKSVLDAFSGGANVGYFLKKKGLRVVSNDKLAYSYHIARAVVENSTETLSEGDISAILAENSAAGDFCVKNFAGYYFTKPILAFLDQIWANIQKLEGYKKDLALAALGWTVVGKAKFGEFSRSKQTSHGKADEERQTSISNVPLSEFKALLEANIGKANRLVFDNGQKCLATKKEALDAIGATDCDMVYADPPYVTEFAFQDSERKLHFVEGLMTMWKGKELRDNALRDFESGTKYTRESIGVLIGDVVKASAGRMLLLSYRDKAFPDEKTIKGFLEASFSTTKVSAIEVEYEISKTDSEANGRFARELLFLGTGAIKAKADTTERRMHAFGRSAFQAQLTLSADAAEGTDKKFEFILTHAGTNRNGDHFTKDELKKNGATAVGKKVDLSHDQAIAEIVGKITEAKYVEDDDNSRVECSGVIYTAESPNGAFAYRLMKEKLIANVSMECDYQQGECSICKKMVKSKAEYCTHLRNYKGKAFQGKPCYEILHGVTFTGVGLLDRVGADQKAEISQVAALDSQQVEETMADEKKPAKGAVDPMGDPTGMPEADLIKMIKMLQSDNEKLTKDNDGLQQKLDGLAAQQKATERKVKAEKVLADMESAGDVDEAGKSAELDRLLKMGDEAFDATAAMAQRHAAKKKAEEPVVDPNAEPDPKKFPFGKKPTKKADLDATAALAKNSPDGKGSTNEARAAALCKLMIARDRGEE